MPASIPHLIEPHGGTLIQRVVSSDRAAALAAEAAGLAAVQLSAREQCDLEMIAIGAFSPLTGFMQQADFESVVQRTRLSNGLVWPIPITLSVSVEAAQRLSVGQRICLTDSQARPLAVMTVESKYQPDRSAECAAVYGTQDPAHPGVAGTMSSGPVNLGGPIEVLTACHEPEFVEHRLSPAQTRAEFNARGWLTVSAFQTRNPIHRAHEYLTKVALEMTDGLLIHPLVGETKPGDIPADVRMACYKVLIEKYYNLKRTMLSVMPAAMRYAGPKEAILHALVRKNYGVTHFIVGRDHAGVGSYYGTYDAQKIFDQFEPGEIGIVPLKFENTFFCRKTGGMASDKTTNSAAEDRIFLAGTKVREMLLRGERPPAEFTRPEVADILIESARRGE